MSEPVRSATQRAWSWLVLILAGAVVLDMVWVLVAPLIVPVGLLVVGGVVGRWLLGRGRLGGGYR